MELLRAFDREEGVTIIVCAYRSDTAERLDAIEALRHE